MKRLLMVLSVLAVALTGCLDPSVIGVKNADQHNTAKSVAVQRPPVVQPGEVNETNAHAMALALKAELDFDARPEEVKTPAQERKVAGTLRVP